MTRRSLARRQGRRGLDPAAAPSSCPPRLRTGLSSLRGGRRALAAGCARAACPRGPAARGLVHDSGRRPSPVTSVRPRPPFRAPRSLRRSPCHALWLWGDEAVPAKPGAPDPGGGGHRAPRTAADLGGPGKRVLPHARTQLPARGQLHQRRRKSTRKEQVSLNRFPFEGPLLAGDPVWVGGLAPREAAGQDLRAGMQGTGARSAETPAQDRAGRHQESWAHPGPRKGCAPNPGGAGGRGPRALRI